MRKGTIHIVQRMAPGGIEQLVRDLAGQLPGENRIFSLEGRRKEIIDDWPALEPYAKQIRGFNKGSGLRPGLVFELRSVMRQLKPQAVVTHHLGPLIYGGLAARLTHVPTIAHVEHDIWHYELPRHRIMTRAVCSIVRPKLVGVSYLAADKISEITGDKSVSVIHNGVDIDRFTEAAPAKVRAKWDIPANVPVVGAVGRLEKVKGHDVLIDAMMQLPENIILVIAGGGSQMGALQDKVKTLGIEEQVRFLGNVDNTAELYPAFDVLCLPSRNEGLPLTILEAQSCGIPVVATDVGSVRDAIDPDIGVVVQSEDSNEMAAAIVKLLQAKELKSPRGFVIENFSWGNTLKSYSRLVGA